MSDLENANAGQELRRRRARRLRWRRRVRVGWARRWLPRVILALALAVFGVYRVLTDPARVQRLTQAYVQQFFATPVTIGAVDFSLTTGIRLTDVRVGDPDGGSQPAMLAIEGMWLQHDPFELLVGRVAVDEIVATRPVCRARFAADLGKFNIQRVLRAPPSEGKGGLRQLPVLRVRDAHLEIYADADPATAAIEDVALSLTATPDSAGRRYDVAWVAQADRRSQGRFLVDLRAGIIEDQEDSGAPWLSLEAASLAIEATEPRAGRWLDLLGVRGHFRIVDFALGFRGARSGANRLTMEFENAGLSVPVEAMEDELPPARRFVRLDGVAGRVAVDAAGATANLYGRLGQAACRLRGRLLGDVQRETSFADLGFEVDADVEGLVLPRQDADAPPREVRFIHRWERLSHFYRDFDPHGVVDLTASLRKVPGAGAPIELRRARIESRGANVAVRMFPYRVEDVRGTVEITPQGVYLHGLTGRHADAAIAADGWFGAMSLRSQAELTIRGAGVALDDDLCAAISGRHRRTWERFGPRGFANLTVRMSRPEGADGPEPWAIAIDADLLGVDAAFEGFPYPLRDLRGPVRIAGDTFRVDRVRGDCGAGTLVADGFVRTSPNGVEQLDLRLTADALPLDETLLAALPPATRAELANLHPAGTAAVTVDLTDRDGAVTYDIAAEVEGVDLCPEGFPLPIADLNGSLRIKPGVIELHDLRGAACDGGIRVDGRIVRGAEADSAVTIRGEQIRLTDALRAALPEVVRAQLAPWRIEGRFDVERRTGGTGGQTLRLELDGATIAHEDFTLPWRVATGDVIVEGQRVWLRGVRAVSGGAELTLEGEIDAAGGRLEYTLRGLKLGEEFRMALPWRVRRQWNDLAPHGAVDVFGGLLAWRTDPTTHQPVWRLAGAVQLHDVGFVAGLPVSGMTGTIDVGGEAPNGLADVFLKGDMRLDRVQVGRYAIENLTGRILRDGAGKRLRFDELRGALYGGAVSGELNIDGGRGEGEYSLEATVQRAGVEGFVRAHRPASAAAEDHVHGYVDGRFFLTGKLSDPAQRRGGGRVQVRDAELYRLPLLLAVLHVINLAVPEESAFQSGSARLTVVGDEVRFRNLELTGEALSLVGGGTMAISTGALDLQLVTVSPHRWGNMPVVTEMLEGMSRELLEVQVRGTLGEPRATAQPLRNMEAVLEALLTMRETPQEHEPVAPGEP